jgi:hypothetical protein
MTTLALADADADEAAFFVSLVAGPDRRFVAVVVVHDHHWLFQRRDQDLFADARPGDLVHDHVERGERQVVLWLFHQDHMAGVRLLGEREHDLERVLLPFADELTRPQAAESSSG